MIKKTMMALVVISLFTSIIEAGTTGQFLKNLVKMTKGKADDVVRKLPSTKDLSRALSKNIDFPKLTPLIKKSPEKITIANKADKIVSKSDFEKKFFIGQNFDNQLSMIVQSSKYGDEYFDMAKNVSIVSPNVIKANPNLLAHFPVSQLNQKTLQTKFIETLNKTGKYGWERLQDIGNWVVKHPKISTASGAYAWYVLDPESFNEQLKSSGKTLTLFLMETTGSIVSGGGEAITGKVEEIKKDIEDDVNAFIENKVDEAKVSSSYILTRIAGILLLIGLFIAWRKRKIIYHFITKADEVKTDKSGRNSKNIRFEKDEDEF